MTKPARTVCRSLKLNPEKYLRNFKANSLSNAKTKMKIHYCYTLRSVICGFFTLSQVIELVESIRHADIMLKKAIKKGREPPFQGVQERVIRLSGCNSDVTELSLIKYDEHIFPIYQEYGPVKKIVESHSSHYSKPIWWKVKNHYFGEANSFNRFIIQKSWFLRTKNGEKVFLVEADSSVGDEALAIINYSQMDLDLQETAQGFRALKKLAVDQGVLDASKNERFISVLLTNTQEEIVMGTGRKLIAGKLIRYFQEADIIIDAQNPLIKNILMWAKEKQKTLEHNHAKQLIFFTSNQKYFATIKYILAKYGWNVIDDFDHQHILEKDIPCLVYQNKTGDTVNTIQSLILSKAVKPEMILGLLDKQEGMSQMNRIEDEFNTNIDFLCSAYLYDELFKFVRVHIRNGDTNQEIQQKLNNMWKDMNNLKI